MRKASGSAPKGERGRGAVGAGVKTGVKAGRKKSAAPVARPARPTGAVRAAKAAPREARGIDRRASEKVLHGGRVSPSTDAATGASRGKYVYCIIEAPDALRFGPVGIGADPSEFYPASYRSLTAVVSEAPLDAFDSTVKTSLRSN